MVSGTLSALVSAVALNLLDKSAILADAVGTSRVTRFRGATPTLPRKVRVPRISLEGVAPLRRELTRNTIETCAQSRSGPARSKHGPPRRPRPWPRVATIASVTAAFFAADVAVQPVKPEEGAPPTLLRVADRREQSCGGVLPLRWNRPCDRVVITTRHARGLRSHMTRDQVAIATRHVRAIDHDSITVLAGVQGKPRLRAAAVPPLTPAARRDDLHLSMARRRPTRHAESGFVTFTPVRRHWDARDRTQFMNGIDAIQIAIEHLSQEGSHGLGRRVTNTMHRLRILLPNMPRAAGRVKVV
jgi:hypothetical protein